MEDNTTGTGNSAFGVSALRSNTTGTGNMAFGNNTLEDIVTGSNNIAIGSEAMRNATAGNSIIAIGYNALKSNAGSNNLAIGPQVLQGDGVTAVTGNGNIGIGNLTMYSTTTGGLNVAIGGNPMLNNRTGQQNVAIGTSNLFSNVEGSFQTAVGRDVLRLNTSILATFGTITGGSGYVDGTYTNVTLLLTSTPTPISTFTAPVANFTVSGGAVTALTLVSGGNIINSQMTFGVNNASLGGTGSGFSVPVGTLTTGAQNTALGYAAGRNNITGSGNVFIGYQAGQNELGSNRLYIDNSNTASPLIYGEFDNNNVKINGDFQLTTKTPASAAATGVTGTIAWDADYIYICTATNTWKRVAISTW
jgi:hypothetical protein